MQAHIRESTTAPRILDAVLANGAGHPTFAKLGQLAGTSKRSMTTVVNALEPDGVLARDPLRFGSGAGLVLAFEIGVEDLRGALVDANGDTFCAYSAEPDPSQLDGPPTLLLGRLRTLAHKVLAAGLDSDELSADDGCLPMLGATVAWPCPVGRDGFAHGHVFPDAAWRAIPLRQHLGATLGAPFDDTRVDSINAANAAVMAVAFDRTRSRWDQERASEHSEIAMVVRVQGGISAGTVQIARHLPGKPLAFLSSRLVVGTQGFAGELGHLPISTSVLESINEQRPRGLAPILNWECSCGQRDHLEGLASARALLRRLHDSNYQVEAEGPIGPQITRLAGTPDEVLARARRDIGRLIGRALLSPILMLDPASVTVTGYLASQNVVDGIGQEHHRWHTGISSSVTIGFLQGHANDLVERRGAALTMFRQKLYRRMKRVSDSTLREKLIAPLSRDHLSQLE